MNPSFRTRLRLGASALAVIAASNAAIAQEPNAPPPRLAGERAGNAVRTPTPPAPHRKPGSKRHAAVRGATRRRHADPANYGDGPEGNAERGTETGDDRATAGRPSRARTGRSGPSRTGANSTGRRRPPPRRRRRRLPPPEKPPVTRAFTQQVERSNQVRENILPKTGTSVTQVTQPGHQQRAGRRQPVGQRYSRDPVPRRLAGFDVERRLSRAQRPRQRAVPHQRNHPARRRLRLRPVPGDELHRQDGAHHRCAAGAIRTAQHRDPRHHLEGFHHQSEQRLGRCLWRHLRHDHADIRIWRQGRPDRIFLRRPRIPELSRPRKSDPERHCAP